MTTAGGISVALALPGEESEAPLLEVIGSMSGGRVTRRCLDVAELVGLAQSGRVDVAIIGGRMLRWNRDAVARLQACGVGVVALCRDDDQARRMTSLGVDAVVVVESAAQVPLRADSIADAVAVLARRRPGSSDRALASRGFAHGARDPGEPVTAPSPAERDEPEPPRTRPPAAVVAVWGPTGAPGRTTIACGLAGVMARAGLEVLLVDADPYGGTVAQHLGLLDDPVPGLAAACRLAHHGRLTPDALVPLARGVAPNLSLLTGLPRADRWPELRPASLSIAWESARRVADVVVVDVGFCLEEDEELSYDTLAPRRNAATISALASADTIVAVGSGDPIGLRRLVRGLDELEAAVPGCAPLVVVNRGTGKGRQSAVGRDVEHLLRAVGRRVEVQVVPEDLVTCRRAVREGLSAVEVAPGSSMVRALEDLARTCAPGIAGAMAPRDEGSGLRRLRRLVG